ncbi:hypothetical protein K438DRAFT_1979729 [Mycena galopus ATCC 62051]|nr:hypothetical protein K438DRAFT_1979729 [Mycena galopus ATCC 62051]
MFNWALLGSLVLQVYSYHQVYHKNDRAAIKWLVYVIFVLEIIFSMLLTHMNFTAIITNWGNPDGFIFLSWSACTVTPGSGVMAAMVQIFFAWRIWKLNKHIIARCITVLIVLLALLQSISSIALTIVWKTKYQLSTILLAEVSILKDLTSLWLAGSLAVDILIAGVMVFSLMHSRRTSPIRRTETLINRIIVNTVETGVITAVTALLDLTLYLLPIQGQTYHAAPAFILGKLYSNVLMANLNGRARSTAFKAGLQDHSESSSGARTGGMQLNAITSSAGLDARGVVVSTHVHSDMAVYNRNDLKASGWDKGDDHLSV